MTPGNFVLVALVSLVVLCGLFFYVRPFGDAIIVLAGADYRELRKWNVDRVYFIGLGLSLVMAATIATVALVIGTSIAFDLPPLSKPSIVMGAVYFLLILSLDRWLVSDQTAGFATEPGGRISATAAWIRHFIAELLKVAPRMAIAFFAAALFADFILLVVFKTEIAEQMRVLELQAQAQFSKRIEDEIARRTADEQQRIQSANNEKRQVQEAFKQGADAIQQAAQQRNAALAQAQARGIRCRSVSVFATRRNPTTGRTERVRVGSRQVCPKEITEILEAYKSQVALFPQSQADVATKQTEIDKRYDVGTALAYVNDGARQEVFTEFGSSAPKPQDGLLVRMRALELLTQRPAGECVPSSAVESSFSDACISRYSSRASTLQWNLRIWLLALELAPVLLKFVAAILPRRGYASIMAARDEEAKTEAAIKTGQLRNRIRIEVERFLLESRTRMEALAATEEVKIREIERERRRWGVRSIRGQMGAAAAGLAGPSSRTESLPRRRGPDTEDTIPLLGMVLPREAPIDRGMRVHNSEEFLDKPQ